MIDEMAKQARAMEEYKQMKSKDLPEYKGDYKSPHYEEVKSQTISPTKPKKSNSFQTVYEDDFGKAAKDYWKRATENGLIQYDAGSFAATFGRPIKSINELLERLSILIRESVSNELIKSGASSESLSESFKLIDLSLSILSNHIESLEKNSALSKHISVEDITAYLHGFINTCVSSMKTANEERERDG